MKNKKELKKVAFSLAEVLITLSILGVIATIIISNLIGHYKKTITETKLKMIYSQLSSVIDQMNVEYKPVSQIVDEVFAMGAATKNATDAFNYNYFRPYIKFTRECPFSTKGCRIFTDNHLKGLDGTTNSNGDENPSYWHQYQLSNGMFLGNIVSNHRIHFIVDINGSAGSNQIGSDIFYFSIYDTINDSEGGTQKDSLDCGRGANYGPSKGYSTQTLFYPQCTGRGHTCSCPIKNNGWKIPKDYPVKF